MLRQPGWWLAVLTSSWSDTVGHLWSLGLCWTLLDTVGQCRSLLDNVGHYWTLLDTAEDDDFNVWPSLCKGRLSLQCEKPTAYLLLCHIKYLLYHLCCQSASNRYLFTAVAEILSTPKARNPLLQWTVFMGSRLLLLKSNVSASPKSSLGFITYFKQY